MEPDETTVVCIVIFRAASCQTPRQSAQNRTTPFLIFPFFTRSGLRHVDVRIGRSEHFSWRFWLS